ncbi:hypothetical protein BJY04DRAFT_181932 [Aspergillus karnatakaensis]|uniref:uncharacterized protein n=1 Tax=Aspergillus karnatakaensis TaxID=1810916 RepID=UPI003CCD6CAD
MPPGLGKAIGDPNNDDYVAQILSKEARDSSMKYSSLGMNAYMPSRPTGSAPKPNTRFLRHIIKETDNHNTALKRKEEKEARERMRQLRDPVQSDHVSKDQHQRRSHRHDGRDRDSRRDRRDDHDNKHRSHRRRQRSRSASPHRDRARDTRRRFKSRARDDDRQRRSRRSHRHRSYSKSRSRSPYSGSRSHRHRHRNRSNSRSRSPELRVKHKDKGAVREVRPSPMVSSDSRDKPFGNEPGNESDPLEDLVGPLPKEDAPIRSRGRGAYRPNTSNIDAHFAPDYDPTLDVHAEENGLLSGNRSSRRPVAGLMTGDDDWELALEALRDRARWKQQGEERLRKAGFNDDIVDRWKNNSTATGNDEESLENVKWSTKSEGREWDRGKFVDKDGHIDIKASW